MRDPAPPSDDHSPPSLSGTTTPRIVRVSPASVTPESLRDAGETIRRGGLVAFPTETVYGLGADALNDAAVRRIYAAKGRPSFNPLIVHVLDVQGAERLARVFPDVARTLADAFWPGPLTLVVPRRDVVPDGVTAGLDTVGLRAPSHPVARALLAAADRAIAAPSANRYTRVSPTTAAHVLRQLGDRVDVVVDGGSCDVGIESTVLDVSTARPTLLRPGGISREAIERVLGAPVDVVDPADFAAGAPRPSPGMVDRHYAPRARVEPFDAGDREGAERRLRALASAGERVGVVSWATPRLDAPLVRHLPGDPAGYARALYAALHAIDDASCTVALIERVPEGEGWAGVADRLRRAGVAPHEPRPGIR